MFKHLKAHKYGADYAEYLGMFISKVFLGDINSNHSKHLIYCHDNEKISISKLMGYQRIAASVNKIAILDFGTEYQYIVKRAVKNNKQLERDYKLHELSD